MTIIESYRKLREMADDELVDLYDKVAPRTELGLYSIRAELQRRANERQYQRMVRLSNQMRNQTIVITALTVVNVILVAITTLKM